MLVSINLQAPIMFDFEGVYKEYRRKEGKAAGFKKLNKVIKTQAQFEDLQRALRNYNRLLDQRKTEKQYIKHFSTFVNSHQDYVEIEEQLESPLYKMLEDLRK